MSTRSDPFLDRLDAAARGDDRPDEHIDTWRPVEPGSRLVGRLVRIVRDVQTQYGPADVAHIDDELAEQTLALWLTSVALKQAWSDANPAPGDRVGVVFVGEKTSANGRTYKRWSVLIDEQRDHCPEVF